MIDNKSIDATALIEQLREKHRSLRDNSPPALNLRVHRALSWMTRADREAATDHDAAFIFYWIAFNAAYARDVSTEYGGQARDEFGDFFDKLVAHDDDRRIYRAIWNKFSGPIRLLLGNRYVFSPFWKYHNGDANYANWEIRFNNAAAVARNAFANTDTPLLLSLLFDRLYILRNQLVHGGATWNSKVNRAQVTDGYRILETLVPVFTDILMSNPQTDWGQPYYPVVESVNQAIKGLQNI